MKIFVIIGAVVIAIAGAWYLFSQSPDTNNRYTEVPLEEIRSFADCERAGYPVMESYPRQCAVPDGRTYAEEIIVEATYENASADMIVVELPYLGAVVGKEFKIMGEARGNWYFEASFPIEIVSPSGSVIAGSFATAQGDWMTTEFVPYESEIIDLPSAYRGPATVILRKDNPSGLPENDAFMSFPIVVEY